MDNVRPQGLIISGEDIYDRCVEGGQYRRISSHQEMLTTIQHTGSMSFELSPNIL